MSIVIRPAPGVFRRTMPLVVVFGAYRRHSTDLQLSREDFDVITGVVSTARRFHVPLAFSRVVPADRSPEAGIWLPECRPKISDRVFDHPKGTAFENREFFSMYNRIIDRSVYFVGPQGDSSMQASFADASDNDHAVRIITADSTLHFCSAMGQHYQTRTYVSPQSSLHSQVTLSEWENSMRVVEHVA